MSDLTDRARDLAKRLLRENRAGRSWRKIAKEDYDDQINFATLNRIANEAGEWLPKDRRILKVLGLLERRKRTAIEKAITKMARATKRAVLKR